MIKKYEYTADAGSILLMHKSGAKFRLSNNYGDGDFDFYIIDNEDDLERAKSTFKDLKDTGVWVDDEGWKVMDYDCSNHYNNSGIELLFDCYASIYQIGNKFIFYCC